MKKNRIYLTMLMGLMSMAGTLGVVSCGSDDSDDVFATEAKEVSLDKVNVLLYVGEAQETVSPTILVEGVSASDLIWTSSNPSVATVDANGVITPVAVGRTNISVRIKGHTAVTNCAVEVTYVKVESVMLDKKEISMLLTETEQLTATVLPENAGIKTYKWSTTNKDIVTVENGLVKPLNTGKAQIIVTTDDQKKADTCTVVITRYSGLDYQPYPTPEKW